MKINHNVLLEARMRTVLSTSAFLSMATLLACSATITLLVNTFLARPQIEDAVKQLERVRIRGI